MFLTQGLGLPVISLHNISVDSLYIKIIGKQRTPQI